ncbi:MAG: hypothetical protein FWF81_12815 [Defluviitaleaceae bacterium]|nr:hypothetical protein [Defluviitaleaceae bacterium]
MEKNTCAVAEYLRVFDCIKTFSELDKELYVHDYCLNHFRYDYDFGKYAYSVLGAVLCQSAACEGIAKFVKLALDSVGVKNLVVKGEAKDPTRDKHEPHAWNIVKIANETFHLDVTFDMTLKDKFNRYDYFNLSDKDISADHVTTMAVPACVAQGKDYFAMRGMTARTPIELRSYVKTCISRGDKNIHVKLYDMRSSENIAEKVAGLVLREYGKNVSVNVRYNPLQCVFEIDVHSL